MRTNGALGLPPRHEDRGTYWEETGFCRCSWQLSYKNISINDVSSSSTRLQTFATVSCSGARFTAKISLIRNISVYIRGPTLTLLKVYATLFIRSRWSLISKILYSCLVKHLLNSACLQYMVASNLPRVSHARYVKSALDCLVIANRIMCYHLQKPNLWIRFLHWGRIVESTR